MKIYVFGNQDINEDNTAFSMANKLKEKIYGIEIVEVKPNEDLPFVGEENVVLMDTVEGIDKISLINGSDLDKVRLTKSVSVHDFDLGFQLKYLKKIGKLKQFTIIGLPKGKKANYLRIQSILRKLVEQEMQGS